MQEKDKQQIVTRSNNISPISDTLKTSDSSEESVCITSTIAKQQWNNLVETATEATPFHRYEFLKTLAEHSGTTFHSILGRYDDRPLGLFPVFERSFGPYTALFSPAPSLKVRYLGPVLFEREDVDPAEHEQHGRDFLNAVLSCFADRYSPEYILVRTSPGFGDHRPFVWEDFEATPQYSYVVDLTPDASTLLDTFSSDARSNIQDEGAALTLSEEGNDAIAPLIDQIRARHDEQGQPYRITSEFVTDLYEHLPTGIVRPYVVRKGAQMVGGMIALEHGDTVYRWQGGVRPEMDLPVNELLDWHIMQRAADRGCTRYDLVGANQGSIARYKAKFNPELVTFQSLVRSTRTMDLVSSVYKRLR